MGAFGKYRFAAMTRAYFKRLSWSQSIIMDVGMSKPIAVSVSGGKDSLVMLDLVLSSVKKKNVKPFLIDCGTLLPDTHECIDRMSKYFGIEIETVKTSPQLTEAFRAGNYWGYKNGDPKLYGSFDFDKILVSEPSDRFMKKHELDTVLIGTRSEENPRIRGMNAAVHGVVYKLKSGITRVLPIDKWTTPEIWGHIAKRGLPYSKAYDRMAAIGLPVEKQRTSVFFGTSAETIGRYVYLKMIAPDLFNKFASEFPTIAECA
jgi:3'-phosphoadenosine 5'-phosphosulfate sulfotransferase (PAPS reductase)/FAD synthetase